KLDIKPPAVELGQRDQEIGQRGPLAAKRLPELLHQIMCREIAHASHVSRAQTASRDAPGRAARRATERHAVRARRRSSRPGQRAHARKDSDPEAEAPPGTNSRKAASMTWRTPRKENEKEKWRSRGLPPAHPSGRATPAPRAATTRAAPRRRLHRCQTSAH